MKIIMVASECNPLCKTGGLADVIYSLSRELVQNGHDVTVFLPYYKQLKNKGLNAEYKYYDYVDMSWRHQYIGVFDYQVEGIKFKLIDSEGREYSSSPEGHMALAVEQDSKAKGMLTRLNPNMGTSFTFVFDVPEELPIFTTKFEAKGGMTGKPTLMPLRPIKVETVKD